MNEHTFQTEKGTIHYWVNEFRAGRQTLVFLPGLTADHHLFDRQTECFERDYNVLTWDAPGHAVSRPFVLDFLLMDKAKWLHDILEIEGIRHPVLIGQSMGGYVSQCFIERYPDEAAGFISIDSAPLKRKYMTGIELWLLKRTEPIYQMYPWESLKKAGAKGCAESEYGRALMRSFTDTYTKDEYCKLAAHGYRMLAEAMEADFPYEITCPAILICGEEDKAGSTKRYNRTWAKKEGLPVFWVKGAGHNSNTDKPGEVNQVIKAFLDSLHQKSFLGEEDSI